MYLYKIFCKFYLFYMPGLVFCFVDHVCVLVKWDSIDDGAGCPNVSLV